MVMRMKKKELRVFEGFAGYGGGSFALKRVKEDHPKFNYKVVAYSEIDKYAIELFNANHRDEKGNLIKNYSDITKIDPYEKDFPDFDMFTGGFPCQPFSTAGMQKGVDDPYGRGTLFQHIMRICAVKKPRYILMENVKGLLSHKFDVCGLIGGFFGGFAFKSHCVKTKQKIKGNGNIQINGGINNGEQDQPKH